MLFCSKIASAGQIPRRCTSHSYFYISILSIPILSSPQTHGKWILQYTVQIDKQDTHRTYRWFASFCPQRLRYGCHVCYENVSAVKMMKLTLQTARPPSHAKSSYLARSSRFVYNMVVLLQYGGSDFQGEPLGLSAPYTVFVLPIHVVNEV